MLDDIAGGDCHVFTRKVLKHLDETKWTWTLVHNKQHGAAIVNLTAEFIIIDSQARSAFWLAPGTSWKGENDTTWSMDDEAGLRIDACKFEEVSLDEFDMRCNKIQFMKRCGVVLFR